jgi:hypothetical protein
MSRKPLAEGQARIARLVTFGMAIDAVRADLIILRRKACLEARAPADWRAFDFCGGVNWAAPWRRLRHDPEKACPEDDPGIQFETMATLISRHANSIDGGNTAASIALETRPPRVDAIPTGRIRRVGRAWHNIPAADCMLTGGACRHNDHFAIARQGPVIVDDLIAVGGGRRRCRLVRRSVVADRNAGDERSNPPRLFEKLDQAVLIF